MCADLVGLDHAAQPHPGLAARFLAALHDAAGPSGICRDSYGAGEQHAHDLLAEMAGGRGLLLERDPALNLYVTRPGADRSAPVVMLGSHLDSVPDGGNFDGAAGVASGLEILAGLPKLPCDVTLMAIRAEEAAWFDVSYAGSRAAFGQLCAAELSVPRADTGRSLAEHISALGGDPEAVLRGPAFLRPERIRAFLELHIEQGPVLEHAGLPVGIVTGIAGCRRFRHARCLGRAAHSGAEPLPYRSDPVAAAIQLIARLDQAARPRADQLTFTVGELYTDPASHGPSRIAGEIRFVLDWRSLDETLLDAMQHLAERSAAELGAAHRVRFELGPPLASAPALLDAAFQARLAAAASRAGIATMRMPSGAGHDASVFANTGVPSAMLFVRSLNGSHNPHETMAIEDLSAAAAVARAAIIDICRDPAA